MMNHEIHVALCDHLCRQMASPADCDHTLRRTEAFLSTTDCNKEAAIEWLKDHGGHCDCEVLLNTMPHNAGNERTAD